MTVASPSLGHVLATQTQHTPLQMYGLHTLTRSLPHTYTQTSAHTARTTTLHLEGCVAQEKGDAEV